MNEVKKIVILVILALLALIAFNGLYERCKKLQEENERLLQNTELLIADIDAYRVNDSLSAVRTNELNLTIKQMEKAMADDKELINQLTRKKYDLEKVIASQSQTIYELYAIPKDTTIVVDTTIVQAHSIDIHEKWFDLQGIITEDFFSGTFQSRDSLILLESVQYKKFLFFKTKKIKDKEYNIVSKNPNSNILGFDVISLYR